MLRGYLAEIRSVRPHGPYVLGGACAGTLVAMELARALAVEGEHVGPVILVDPPPALAPPAFRNLDPLGDRAVYQHLYASVEQAFRSFAERFGQLPFDVNDPAQLHRAIEVGIGTVVMFSRYVPPRFDGVTECIVSAERAAGHFHPEGLWKHIVARPGRVHVIPGNHVELFYKYLDEVLRLVRFALEAPFHA